MIFYARDCTTQPDFELRLGSETVDLNSIRIENLETGTGTGDSNDNSYRPSVDYLVTFKLIFNYTAGGEDDGQALRLIVSHPAMNQTVILARNITVLAPPSPHDFHSSGFDGSVIGSPVTLELSFHSNPEPEFIRWFMHDIDGYFEVNMDPILNKITNSNASTEDTRYQLGTLSQDGSTYLTQLFINELLEDDNGKSNMIMVKNQRGTTNYTLTFEDLQPGTLSGGAIAGIVIGVILAVLILAFVAFYFVKKKANKKKSKSVTTTAAPMPQQRTNIQMTSTTDNIEVGQDNAGQVMDE